MKENKSIKIFLKYVLGPLLFIGLTWMVYKQLQSAPDLDRQWDLLLERFKGSGWWLIVWVILLMLLQWSLEAFKWKLMMRPLVDTGFIQALQTIFSGIAFSIVTPNRFGEFAGRILHLPSGSRLQGTVFTFLGNLVQLLMTCIAGFVSLWVYQDQVRESLGDYGLVLTVDLLLLFTPVFSIVLLLVLFGSGYLVKQMMRPKIMRRFEHELLQMSTMPVSVRFHLLWLSVLRYVVFMVQYWIMFRFTGIFLSFEMVFGFVSVMLLWLAIVPTFSMVELGLRWHFALILFSPLTTNMLGTAFVVTAIWLINFILPAILGAFGVIGFQIRSGAVFSKF
jgi:hypothetical protein